MVGKSKNHSLTSGSYGLGTVRTFFGKRPQKSRQLHQAVEPGVMQNGEVGLGNLCWNGQAMDNGLLSNSLHVFGN